MRVLPVTALVSRQAIAPVTLQDHELPKSSLVFIAPWTIHRRADFYPDPLRFDPERFTPERQANRPNMAYIPFSGGPRACIGQGFAMMQMKINLAMLLQRYRFHCPSTYSESICYRREKNHFGSQPTIAVWLRLRSF